MGEIETKRKKSSFTSSIGFVLASAGSAVGLGNIWRFPYLAAKGGGGLFLITYIVLAVTFGFTLLTTDVIIGKKTRKSSIQAYKMISPKFKFAGYIAYIIPALIITYYTVIGGWIIKYLVVFITGHGADAAGDGYFTGFITSPIAPIVYMIIFLGLTAFIVYNGVEKGIEKSSKWIMPALFVMVVAIAFFSLFLKHDGRTGLQGLKLYIVPNFEGITFKGYAEILLSAMGQLFFSLSVAMGIMITYGSYVKDDVNISRSLGQVEFFDTMVAFLAGMMIIPAVYVFYGIEGMKAGPGLIFISLPKIFTSMGWFGTVVAIIFFVMVLFAALTSCVSILETIVANTMEIFNKENERRKVTLIISAIALVFGVLICLGYTALYFELPLPTGGTGQLLDIADYISNSFLMPIIALITSFMIGWVVTPDWVIEEIEKTGNKFRRKKLYIVMIKYVAPVMLLFLFFESTGLVNILVNLIGR